MEYDSIFDQAESSCRFCAVDTISLFPFLVELHFLLFCLPLVLCFFLPLRLFFRDRSLCVSFFVWWTLSLFPLVAFMLYVLFSSCCVSISSSSSSLPSCLLSRVGFLFCTMASFRRQRRFPSPAVGPHPVTPLLAPLSFSRSLRCSDGRRISQPYISLFMFGSVLLTVFACQSLRNEARKEGRRDDSGKVANFEGGHPTTLCGPTLSSAGCRVDRSKATSRRCAKEL